MVEVAGPQSRFKIEPSRVLFGTRTIKGADPATFEVLNHMWARDCHRVYTYDHPLSKADVATFEPLNAIFAKDNRHVFFVNGVVPNADAPTFEVLDPGWIKGPMGADDLILQGYGRDGLQVFFHAYARGIPKVVRKADVQTFVSLNAAYARDARAVYFEGKVLRSLDPDTFQVVGRYWGKDRRQVVYLDDLLPDADPATFKVVDATEYLSRDRHNTYQRASRVGPAN